MKFNQKKREHDKKTKQALATISKGDKVKIVDCWEAELYSGRDFTVESEATEIGGAYYFWINGIGYFDVACLEKVS